MALKVVNCNETCLQLPADESSAVSKSDDLGSSGRIIASPLRDGSVSESDTTMTGELTFVGTVTTGEVGVASLGGVRGIGDGTSSVARRTRVPMGSLAGCCGSDEPPLPTSGLGRGLTSDAVLDLVKPSRSMPNPDAVLPLKLAALERGRPLLTDRLSSSSRGSL